ncbi:MAG: hypothetical protein FAF05_06800 [Epsilonproteobacteria bacterium]|nr:hypothetical protein [Campylobacterota bacterium]
MTKKLQKQIEQTLSQVDFQTVTPDELHSNIEMIIDDNTQRVKNSLKKLLEQKEEIERNIEKKSDELQEQKYAIFHAMEEKLQDNPTAIVKLHQIKLQSIDLYDILSEIVESSIITALERENEEGDEYDESLTETLKEITFESIKEGPLNTIRIRKILSTILATAIEIAEAQPNKAKHILNTAIKGMHSGLLQSIHRFKKRLAYMPIEAKHILIEDYDTIMEDLNQTDTLFNQVIIQQASQSSSVIYTTLIDIDQGMKYDLEELIVASKETAEVMKKKFANFAKIAVKKADSAIHSQKAQEAKRIGKEALIVAKSALGSAIKSAKDVIDKNKS